MTLQLGVPLAFGAATAERALASCVSSNFGQILGNSFTTYRDLNDYDRAMPRLRDDLLERPRTRWLDAGAGDAEAQIRALDRGEFRGVEAVGLSVEMPSEARERVRGAEASGRYRYLSGRFIEDIPAQELGKFDVVTDYYGPLSYTAYPDEVLDRYLASLSPGGSIHLVLNTKSTVQTAGGPVSLVDWISRHLKAQGCEVSVADAPLGAKYIRIGAPEGGAKIQVPRVEVTSFQSRMPPERVFLEIPPGGRAPHGLLRRQFDVERRLQNVVQALKGSEDVFGSPAVYRLMREEPEHARKLLDRWYGEEQAAKLVRRLKEALPPQYVDNLIDPGVATRLDRFVAFARAELARRPGLSPLELRQSFARSLGTRRVYHGRMLRPEQLAEIRRHGIPSPAVGQGWEAAALRENFGTHDADNVGLRIEMRRRLHEEVDRRSSLIPVSRWIEPTHREVLDEFEGGSRTFHLFELEVPEISVIEVGDVFRGQRYWGHEGMRFRTDRVLGQGAFEVPVDDPGYEMFLFNRVAPEHIREVHPYQQKPDPGRILGR